MRDVGVLLVLLHGNHPHEGHFLVCGRSPAAVHASTHFEGLVLTQFSLSQL